MTGPTGKSSAPAEARQRWRIRYARDATVAEASQRDESEVWTRALGAGFPTIVRSGRRGEADDGGPGRPRVALGPALPVGAEADDEPLEFELTDRQTVADVRTRLESVIPPGRRLVHLHDVWIGAPALPALVRDVEYRIEVTGSAPGRIAEAAGALLRTDRLERERTRGSRGGRFDLRPLVADVGVDPVPSEGADAIVRFVGRVDPSLGTGRPDDLLAALSEFAGAPLLATRIVRTRVRLADD